jgi:hypothetical protein
VICRSSISLSALRKMVKPSASDARLAAIPIRPSVSPVYLVELIKVADRRMFSFAADCETKRRWGTLGCILMRATMNSSIQGLPGRLRSGAICDRKPGLYGSNERLRF